MISGYKLLCILIILLVFFQLQTRCIEGLNQLNSITNCIDDPNWSVEDSDGMVYTCSNIGAQVSCYDRDVAGREGWDRCLQSCGNCADVQVSQLPMNRMATFSGDPYEDFGVVLNIDESREFTVNNDELLDEAGFVDMNDGYDYEEMQSRVETVELVSNLLSGDNEYYHPVDNACTTSDLDQFNGYRTCIPLSTDRNDYGLTQEQQLIDNFSDYFGNSPLFYKRSEDGTFQFPPIEIDVQSSSGYEDELTGCDLRDVFDQFYSEPDYLPYKKPYQYEGCYNYELTEGDLEDENGVGDCPPYEGDDVENCFHTRNSITNGLRDIFSAVDTGSSLFYYGSEQGSNENLLDRCHYLCSRGYSGSSGDWYSGNNYMGITRGGECYCLDTMPDEELVGDGAWRCGNNGERCLGEGNCNDVVSVYSLKHQPVNHIESKKSEICNSLLLKDRIDLISSGMLDESVNVDDEDDEGDDDVPDDERLTLPPVYHSLGDICPKTCKII